MTGVITAIPDGGGRIVHVGGDFALQADGQECGFE
jgi:hypothetical protein